LFEALKNSGCAPVLISFNGNFVRSANESQLEALIRLLSAAMTLIDPSDSSKYSFSGQQALLTHIERSAGESPVVLLIDELNVLSSGMPLDSDASQFLKRYFLDMKQRYLVFTSHILLDLDQVSSLFIIPLYSDHVFYPSPFATRLPLVPSCRARSIRRVRAASSLCISL
jgi:ABC-type Na+ transport system ATPase subunit NatA